MDILLCYANFNTILKQSLIFKKRGLTYMIKICCPETDRLNSAFFYIQLNNNLSGTIMSFWI